jgi:hypothetical protein
MPYIERGAIWSWTMKVQKETNIKWGFGIEQWNHTKKHRKRGGLELNEEGDTWPTRGEKEFGVEWRRFMNKVLEPYIWLFVQVLLDDFWVYGSWEMHLCNSKQVFYWLVMANASLNFKKCCFKCMEGILLGHMGFTQILPILKRWKIFLFPRQRVNCEQFWGKWVITKGSSRGMQPMHITLWGILAHLHH